MGDEDELQALIEEAEVADNDQNDNPTATAKVTAEAEAQEEKREFDLLQYSVHADGSFFPCGKTSPILHPGSYEFCLSDRGPFFLKTEMNNEALLRFPDSNIDKVVEEIEKFWSLEKHFNEHHLTYKRGILLWGPPGSGKSCAVRLIGQDVVNRGGIIVGSFNPKTFLPCYRVFRKIQPDTPLVVLIEDLDALLEEWQESLVLNILDGIVGLNKVAFVATTNYPEKLGARIVNRPARFDKRFKIGFPNADSRRMYLKFIWKDGPDDIIKEWVKESEGFTFAHLRELFVGLHLFESNFEETLTALRKMKERVSSEFDEAKAGFTAKARLGGNGITGWKTP